LEEVVNPNRSRTFIETFHPGWPGVPLGTAGVAIATLFDPLPGSSFDTQLGTGLVALALLFLLPILLISTIRLLKHKKAFLEDLANPGMGALFGTLPAAMLVIALDLAQLGIEGNISKDFAAYLAVVLALTGILLALGIGFAFFSRVINHAEFPVAAISGAWFIPVVVLVLAPSTFIRTERLLESTSLNIVFVLSVALWGAGFFLFIFLDGVVAWRLITTPTPPAHMAATWFIWLAPFSAGALGLIAIIRWSAEIFSFTGSNMDQANALGMMAGLSLWGIGTWWLAFALLQVMRMRREIHFHIGSWGFSFPLAAYTALSLELGRMTELNAISNYASSVWIILVGIWFILIQKTILGVISRSIFSR
jgi:C4-dicarboxylate transporter/malic acid transport protein